MLSLEIQSAHYGSPKNPVLENLSLELKAGELVTLLGPNGSGKSTLLKSWVGLHQQYKGSCRLEGKPLQEYSLCERARRISYLPQSPSPEFSFLTEEVILLSRYYRGNRDTATELKQCLQRVVEQMEIKQLLGRRVNELSGGEWQRVTIARTLMQDSDFMLLDEPTAHLDLARRLSFFDLCHQLVKQGKGIFCVTHDLDAALEYSDRMVILNETELVADGKPEEVFTEEVLKTVFKVEHVEIQKNPLSHRPQLVLKSKIQKRSG